MLAQTFKSAKDLKLRQEVYDALVKVYWMLADGVIPKRLFFMGTVGSPEINAKGKPCGSAGCIMGWCNAVTPGVIEPSSYDSSKGLVGPTELNTLCFHPDAIGGWEGASKEQATKALHNYLTTGRANWREVLKT